MALRKTGHDTHEPTVAVVAYVSRQKMKPPNIPVQRGRDSHASTLTEESCKVIVSEGGRISFL